MKPHFFRAVWLLAGLVMFSGIALAQGTVLFSDDFQSGNYADWSLAGDGHDAVNHYEGNGSMRLDGLRHGVVGVSSLGYENVTLSMDMAALYLVYGDYCHAEYSTDGGSTWHSLVSVGAGSDDGLMRTGSVSAGLDDNAGLQLRFRAYTLYNHYCYGDNVMLTGTAMDSGGSPGDGNMYDPLDGDGNVARSHLTHDFLVGGKAVTLMDYSHYALPDHAANPTHVFEGTLTLSGQANGHVQEVGGDNNLGYYARASQLPAFQFDYVQDGTHIIPVTRGKIIGSHPSWIYVLEPGRVWNESGDNGYSRVALPFSLQERNQDCTWNGVMTFLFKDDSSTSDVAYQIAGGTCAYMKLDFWGRLHATYTPHAVADADQIRAGFEAHAAARMPTRPLSALASDYPGSGVNVSKIGSDVSASAMTVYGVAYNGVHYVGGCRTRQGTYPYCDVLDVPSYSSAKSIHAALGLMRLEQMYPGASAQSLGQWVVECSASRWTAPTFGDILNMATGNYDSAGFEVDEGSAAMHDEFFLSDSEDQKIAFACQYPYKAAPGAQFVYHTSDTYLLGRAMNMYYQFRTGDNAADFFDDVMVTDIYAPLGLSPTARDTQRTRDAAAQPYTGYGMVLVRDDVVKLASLLDNDQGRIDGVQVLDVDMLDATLHLGNGGLPAGGTADRYQNGFWYYDLTQSGHTFGCSGARWVPYMSGFGGISVVLFPNGMTYYNFSDGNEQTWISTAIELDKIAPMCP